MLKLTYEIRNKRVLSQGQDRFTYLFKNKVVKMLKDKDDRRQLDFEKKSYQYCLDNELIISKYIPKMDFIKDYVIVDTVQCTVKEFCNRFGGNYRHILNIFDFLELLEFLNFYAPIDKDLYKIEIECATHKLSIIDMFYNPTNFMVNIDETNKIACIYFIDLGMMWYEKNEIENRWF